jgi:hypothetical protein
LRVEDARGIAGHELVITVAIDPDGVAVRTVDLELGLPSAAIVRGLASPHAGCYHEQDIRSVTFTLSQPSCASSCDRVQVHMELHDSISVAPGRLFSCWVRLAPGASGSWPITISGARADDAEGRPLPLSAMDGSIVISAPEPATPTRTPRGRQPTPTATVTLPPAVVEVGSVTVSRGSRATVAIHLRSNGQQVAGLQNDLSFVPEAAIVAAPNGRPACSVNPAIDKPGTVARFLPIGCEAGTVPCRGMRIIVLSYESSAPITDGSLLYSCELSTAAHSAPGRYPLTIERLFLSSPAGTMVDGVGLHGSITVSDDDSAPPRSTDPQASPTPTAAGASPTLTTTATVPVTDGDRPSAAAQAPASSASSGCQLAPRAGDLSPGLDALMGLLMIGWANRWARLRRARAADQRPQSRR